jgi:chaperonin GroES
MTKLNGKVIAGKVLVLPSEAEAKTAGGIFIPDSAQGSPLRGEVVLVGNAIKDQNVEVKVGDKVMYGKYGGTELVIDTTTYLLMSQSEIIYIF